MNVIQMSTKLHKSKNSIATSDNSKSTKSKTLTRSEHSSWNDYLNWIYTRPYLTEEEEKKLFASAPRKSSDVKTLSNCGDEQENSHCRPLRRRASTRVAHRRFLGPKQQSSSILEAHKSTDATVPLLHRPNPNQCG